MRLIPGIMAAQGVAGGGGGGGFALVQSAKGSSASDTVAPAFAGASTTGNLIVLGFASNAYNGTPDSGWTQSTNMEALGNHGGYIWWRISAGETTFGYTIGSATNSAWVLAEFSGNHASPYDVSDSQFSNVAGASYTTPSIVPTAGARLLVGVQGAGNNGDLSAATWANWLNTFTAVDSIGSGGSGTNCAPGMAYRAVTGDGSTGFSTGADFTGTMQTRTGLIIAFKGA